MGASTIMVVEDNEDVRFMLKVALEFKGYRVKETLPTQRALNEKT